LKAQIVEKRYFSRHFFILPNLNTNLLIVPAKRPVDFRSGHAREPLVPGTEINRQSSKNGYTKKGCPKSYTFGTPSFIL
jgi:hypothetical protein